jgi:hypothetical protein
MPTGRQLEFDRKEERIGKEVSSFKELVGHVNTFRWLSRENGYVLIVLCRTFGTKGLVVVPTTKKQGKGYRTAIPYSEPKRPSLKIDVHENKSSVHFVRAGALRRHFQTGNLEQSHCHVRTEHLRGPERSRFNLLTLIREFVTNDFFKRLHSDLKKSSVNTRPPSLTGGSGSRTSTFV